MTTKLLQPTRVLLDMDEVLASFVSGFGEKYDYDFTGLSTYYMSEHIGISKRKFQELLHLCPFEFWYGLEKMPWADTLVTWATKKFDEVYICSKPTHNPECWMGKKAWIDEHYPGLASNMCLIRDKHLLANNFTLLIDDSDINCTNFNKAGGYAIPFPRPWNANKEYAEGKNELVGLQVAHKNMIEEIKATNNPVLHTDIKD